MLRRRWVRGVRKLVYGGGDGVGGKDGIEVKIMGGVLEVVLVVVLWVVVGLLGMVMMKVVKRVLWGVDEELKMMALMVKILV